MGKQSVPGKESVTFVKTNEVLFVALIVNFVPIELTDIVKVPSGWEDSPIYSIWYEIKLASFLSRVWVYWTPSSLELYVPSPYGYLVHLLSQ